jgi:hypothetical protein
MPQPGKKNREFFVLCKVGCRLGGWVESEPDAEFCARAILTPLLMLTMRSEPEPPLMLTARCTALPRSTVMDGRDARWDRDPFGASLIFAPAAVLTAFAGVDVSSGDSARRPTAAITLNWAVRLNIVLSRFDEAALRVGRICGCVGSPRGPCRRDSASLRPAHP